MTKVLLMALSWGGYAMALPVILFLAPILLMTTPDTSNLEWENRR